MSNGRLSSASRVPEREKPRWAWWLSGTGVLVAISIIATMYFPWVRHQWSLSLFRHDDPYTQLAFNQPNTLPAKASPGHEILVSFSITNDEGKAVSYRYVVASGSGAELKTLRTASRTVAAGATWTVASPLVPKCQTTICRVRVSLPQQGEKIEFILNYGTKN